MPKCSLCFRDLSYNTTGIHITVLGQLCTDCYYKKNPVCKDYPTDLEIPKTLTEEHINCLEELKNLAKRNK